MLRFRGANSLPFSVVGTVGPWSSISKRRYRAFVMYWTSGKQIKKVDDNAMNSPDPNFVNAMLFRELVWGYKWMLDVLYMFNGLYLW